MAWNIYDNFLLGQEDGNNIDLNTDTIKIALLKSTYSPDQANDTVWGDISAAEVSGTGYTAGGDAMTGPTCTLAAGTVTFDVPDNVWAQNAGGFTDARYVILVASSGRLISYHDLTTNKGNVDGSFTVEIDAAGVFTKT